MAWIEGQEDREDKRTRSLNLFIPWSLLPITQFVGFGGVELLAEPRPFGRRGSDGTDDLELSAGSGRAGGGREGKEDETRFGVSSLRTEVGGRSGSVSKVRLHSGCIFVGTTCPIQPC